MGCFLVEGFVLTSASRGPFAIAELLFTIFSPYESALLYVQMMDLYLILQFVKGRCHGNHIMLRRCYQRRLIPLAFVALVLENELQYYGLAVRINSGDDGATSSKNLVNLCLVTPEMTGLICIPMYLYWAKIDLTPAFVVLPFRNAK